MLWILGAILTVTGLSGLLLPVVPGAINQEWRATR